MKKVRITKKFIIIMIIAVLVVDAGIFAGLMKGAKASEDAQAAEAAQAQQIAAEEEARAEEAAKAEAAAKAKAERAEKAKYSAHVISHRGASGEETEHTMKAYEKAVEYGASKIEQDVVISADGTLFVSHDFSAERLTGVAKDYSSMSESEIDKLKTEDGQKILKLSEVFDKFGKDVTYVIELKSTGSDATEAFMNLVDKYNMEGNIMVQCMALQPLKDIEVKYPDMKKMYICQTEDGYNLGLQRDYVDIVAVDKSLMSQYLLNGAHRFNREFAVFTLDTENEITNAINLGVDYYFTDDIKLAISLEKKNRGTDNEE